MTMTGATGTDLMRIALQAYDAGLSIIPVRSDGTKKPAVAWKQYQTVRADRDQVRAWFRWVMGVASGRGMGTSSLGTKRYRVGHSEVTSG